MRFATLFGMVLMMSGLVGCGSNGLGVAQGIQAQPTEYAQILAVGAKILADQGVLRNYNLQGRADVNEPGLAVTVSTSVETHLTGVNADATLGMEGTGTRMPPGTREQYIKMLDDPNVPNDIKQTIIDRVFPWNRQPGNPGADVEPVPTP
ncbi:MAG: hypothetical protein ACPGXK_00045 [Phycisphaerae bacterium]